MWTFAKGILGTLFVLTTIALMNIVGTFFGAITGWLVGLVFSDTILRVIDQLFHVHGFSMFQIGAFLGFVGGFFKANINLNKG